MQKITVIGAGIIGLTSAVALQDAGYDVNIVAEDESEHYFRCRSGILVSISVQSS